MSEEINCKDIFIPVMTDEGVCHSFNIFNDLVSHYKDYHTASEANITMWNMETGYSDEAAIETYPRRALLSGASKGLTVNLATVKKDLDFKCNGMFKVVLHSPVRIPKLKQEYFRLPLDQAVIASVQPAMITTSESVKFFDPDKRDCYFPSEKKLKYFSSYSQQNCHLECLTNVTLDLCGCVNMFMPNWLQYVELIFKFPTDPEYADLRRHEYLKDLHCDCLPLCTDLSYNTETSQADWNWEEKFRLLNNTKFDKKLYVFILPLLQILHGLYGPIDFVANFGGLLGLFTGFSILSLMEIVYFLTVRICCNIKLIWWASVFIVCLSGCCFMIYTIYEKYETSPVIVTFATKETPIYKIPFPAVTICPETKSTKEKFSFKGVLQKKLNNENVNSAENRILDYMSSLCDDYINSTSHSNNSIFTEDFFDTLDLWPLKIRPDFMNQAYNCKFMNKDFKCRYIFTPVMTDEGVCYSFNILDRNQIFNDLVTHYKNYHKTEESSLTWSIDRGYTEQDKFNIYPRRALLAGAANGLTMHLATLKEDIDHKCKEVQGYKVVLHTPMRMPRLKQEFFRIPLDQAVVTVIQPVMISTSEAVKLYSIKKRECCFTFERKLKYFRSYSQLNCQLECLTNFTLKKCGCVNIFMPRENQTRICGNAKHECMKEAERTLQIKGIYSKFEDISLDSATAMEDVDCDCIPLCTDLSYNSETSQTVWNWEQNFQTSSEHFQRNLMHLSSLTVYFKFNHFITSERNELYGPTDFLANFGGLLGLFTEKSEEESENVLKKSIVAYFREYCNSTSIHGFRYFGEKRTIYENLQKMGLQSCHRFVCYQRKTHIQYTISSSHHLYGIEKLSYSDNTSFFEVLEEVTPKLLITDCKYLGKSHDCKSLFTPIITDDGLCHTFNLLDRKEMFTERVVHYKNYQNIDQSATKWNIEHGYSEDADVDVYPKRALLAGARYALKFELKLPMEKADVTCRDSVSGYRILFHAPMRLPCLSQQYIRVPLDSAFSAAIRPDQIMTSEAVKNYPAQKRNCYFPSEKKLKYFRVYSQVNCNVECLTEFTLRECGCVLFFMPNDLKILGLQNKILNKQKKVLKSQKNVCDCLPMCTDIDYKIGISQANWNWTEEMESTYFREYCNCTSVHGFRYFGENGRTSFES
ncbi:ASC domain containing protein [Asbolus verrucosus]|uniref:ASC domain containing protein n=1 Tax=Asbolus verrucosus TaxID=1661398 RepID=A0A482V1R8_ASBVE|nr:ASC domain containing protein [Asbolus verrucosus]